MNISQRYRILLYSTQTFVITKLSKSAGQLNKAHQLYLFCTKIIAMNYFRIKDIDILLSTSLSLETEQEKEIINQIKNEYNCNDLICVSNVTNEKKEFVKSNYPALFQWTLFHNALIDKYGTDNLDEKLNRCPKEWISLLNKHDTLFLVFIREWLNYIRSIITDNLHSKIKWNGIPGYNNFTLSFLFEFKKAEILNKPLMDTSVSLLLTDLSLLNFYVKVLFSKTNVCVIASVTESLCNLEIWFKELKTNNLTIPSNFDIDYLCNGFDIIFQSDHHQLLQRTLGLLYNYADLFVGDIRKSLYCDFLLKKYFFTLFLHWDDGSRNAFQQIIVFRLIKLKRSLLHSEGLINVEELASKEHGQSKTPIQSPTITPTNTPVNTPTTVSSPIGAPSFKDQLNNNNNNNNTSINNNNNNNNNNNVGTPPLSTTPPVTSNLPPSGGSILMEDKENFLDAYVFFLFFIFIYSTFIFYFCFDYLI